MIAFFQQKYTEMPHAFVWTVPNHPKGVYPQNYGSLAIVDIDASKGFIHLWVHFYVAIEDNYFDRKGVFLVSTKFKHIFFAVVIFSYQNWSQGPLGTLIFDVFR